MKIRKKLIKVYDDVYQKWNSDSYWYHTGVTARVIAYRRLSKICCVLETVTHIFLAMDLIYFLTETLSGVLHGDFILKPKEIKTLYTLMLITSLSIVLLNIAIQYITNNRICTWKGFISMVLRILPWCFILIYISIHIEIYKQIYLCFIVLFLLNMIFSFVHKKTNRIWLIASGQHYKIGSICIGRASLKQTEKEDMHG